MSKKFIRTAAASLSLFIIACSSCHAQQGVGLSYVDTRQMLPQVPDAPLFISPVSDKNYHSSRGINPVRTVGIVSTCLSVPVMLVGGMVILTHGDGNEKIGTAIASVGGCMLAGGLVMIIAGKSNRNRYSAVSNKPNEIGVAYSFR